MSSRMGHTSTNIQWRCPRMTSHIDRRSYQPDGERWLPVPCQDCYSVIVTATVVPYSPPTPFVVTHPGGTP